MPVEEDFSNGDGAGDVVVDIDLALPVLGCIASFGD